MMRVSTTERQRILDRVTSRCKRVGDCLVWQNAIGNHGYGVLSYKGTLYTAHRLMYLAYHNIDLTREQDVCHKCDNRPCCEIEHLFLGSASVNGQDASDKDRMPRGERNGMSKLTWAQVDSIREKYHTQHIQIYLLAKEYNVSTHTIARIVKNQIWLRIS